MISFKEGNKKFNYRVGAIILNKSKTKVLLHTIRGYGFYLLPGGRVEWLENGEDAIKRELREELGLEKISPRARLFMESFFVFQGVEYQELSFNFVVKLDDNGSNLEKENEFYGLEGDKYIYKWVDIDKIDELVIKPAMLKEVIKNYQADFEYINIDDR